MGGGGKYPYPQWVWSYYGGWWSQPKNVVSNTIVTGLGVATLVALAWNVSANREVRYWPYLLSLLLADSVGRAYYHARATEISAGEGQICGKASSEDVLWELGYCGLPVAEAEEIRHRYPDRWIPSMLWAKEFHDPAFKAMWEKQLATEGRQWIEPIPAWWPFKKSA